MNMRQVLSKVKNSSLTMSAAISYYKFKEFEKEIAYSSELLSEYLENGKKYQKMLKDLMEPSLIELAESLIEEMMQICHDCNLSEYLSTPKAHNKKKEKLLIASDCPEAILSRVKQIEERLYSINVKPNLVCKTLVKEKEIIAKIEDYYLEIKSRLQEENYKYFDYLNLGEKYEERIINLT